MSISGNIDVDFTILGAGIAGLSMADTLIMKGKSVAIIDTGIPGSGSSGAPMVLINPATGRRAKLVDYAEQCMLYAEDLLRRTADFGGVSFYSKNGVLRPALTPKLAKDFQRSPEKYDWPDSGWIQWLGQEEFHNKYPFFGEHYGGLEIPVGITIEAGRYIHYLTEYLRSKGLITYFNADYSIHESNPPLFDINIENDRSFTTGSLINATGSAVKHSTEWGFLPVTSIKGQLLHLRFDEPLKLQHSVSSLGYFAYNPDSPNRLVAGSTYEHHYDDLDTNMDGMEYLFGKIDRTLPGLRSQPHTVTMWAGERISVTDHNPVAGRHPERKNRYILGALGSKGMIYSRYLAEQLSSLILDDKPVDSVFSTERFLDP